MTQQPPGLVRDPTTLPSESDDAQYFGRSICFRHPGYDDSSNVLLYLLASDPTGDALDGRLYAQFALDACGIVTGNRWNGWLSESKSPGSTRVDPASMLEADSYYFHLATPESDDRDLPYAVVPTFEEWEFPHENLPDLWSNAPKRPALSVSASKAKSNVTVVTRERDKSCRMSGLAEETEVAHLCPDYKFDWWKANRMSRYNLDKTTTFMDSLNRILLRGDLHTAFDKRRFVFAPKPTKSGKPMFVTHMLESSHEYQKLYHNHKLRSVLCGTEALFVRFAWAIFPQLCHFLTEGQDRRLLLTTSDTNDISDANGFVRGGKCEELWNKELSMLNRGKKRARDTQTRQNAEDIIEEGEEEEGEEGEEDAEEDGDTRPHKRARREGSGISVEHPLHESAHSSQEHIHSSSSEAKPHTPLAADLTGADADDANTPADPLVKLRETWLAKERAQSDPQGKWNEELAWAQEVYKGNVSMSAAELDRFWEIAGWGETLDPDTV